MIGLQDTSPARTDISRVPYLPGLDGLRAVAVVAVMIYHANHEWLGGGFLGVEVFFVISGYLITLLLVGEHERTGRIALRDFWFRRFRRLLPALFTMMAGLAVYMSLFHRRPMGQTRGDFLGGIFYGSNWYQIFVGQGYTAAEAFAPLRHLWSLAVEEQFYVLWPLIMVVVLQRASRHLPRVGLWLLGISVSIALLTGVLFAGGDVAAACSASSSNGYWHIFGRCISVNETLYLSTITRAGGLMLGAAFAMVWRPAAIVRGPMRDKGKHLDVLAGAGIAILALLMWRLELTQPGHAFGIRFDPWLFRGGFLLTGLATIFVIAAATHQRAATGSLLGNRAFVWIGTRSYGLYLYHWPIYQIIRKEAGQPLSVAQFVLAMAIALPITEASYRFIETPIRKGRLTEILRAGSPAGSLRTQQILREGRRNLAVVLAAVLFLVGTAAAAFASADDLCVGQVACSLVGPEHGGTAGGGGIVVPGTSTTSAPDPTGTEAATPGSGTGTAVTVTTLPATTTTVDLDSLPPLAVGESVMKGVESPLVGAGLAVDAQENRQGEDIVTELQNLRANQQIGRTIVIQTGTNGSVSDARFDQMMASLPQDLTPTVVFMTVTAPDAWIAGNNARIAALPQRYPWVKVVDWAAVAQTVKLCADGSHISCDDTGPARRAYVNAILDALGMPELPPPDTTPTT